MLTRRIGNVWNRCGPRLKNCNQGQVRWEFLGSLAPQFLRIFRWIFSESRWRDIFKFWHVESWNLGVSTVGAEKMGFSLGCGMGIPSDHHHAGSSRDLPAILKSHSTRLVVSDAQHGEVNTSRKRSAENSHWAAYLRSIHSLLHLCYAFVSRLEN